MFGKGNLFAAANLAVFSGLAVGLALRGNDEMGWELTLALLGSTANLAYLLLSLRKEKAADTRRKGTEEGSGLPPEGAELGQHKGDQAHATRWRTGPLLGASKVVDPESTGPSRSSWAWRCSSVTEVCMARFLTTVLRRAFLLLYLRAVKQSPINAQHFTYVAACR